MICTRCRHTFETPVKPMALVFKMMAAFSMAPVHAGMWIWEEFSKEYCDRCRRWLSFLAVVLSAVVLTLALLLFRWVMKVGMLKFSP